MNEPPRRPLPAGDSLRRFWTSLVPLGPMASLACLAVVVAAPILGLPPRVQFLFLAIAAAAIVPIYVHEVALQLRVRQARRRETTATDIERHRIERALGEGAERRLTRARVDLATLARRVDVGDTRLQIAALADELDAALSEIRSITLDEALGLLAQQGLAAALRGIAQLVPVNVSVRTGVFRRYPAALERAMYFCCLEALQNVTKHGGPIARARIRLVDRPGSVFFSVVDSGVGFDTTGATSGMGMSNLADRVALLGGQLHVQSKPGCGTCVRAEIPIPPGSGQI
jgi:signal transduction histidine kinase